MILPVCRPSPSTENRVGLPPAGFFAQGEHGPVGGQNLIHGFTVRVALCKE
jgi:small ligand-binding sensory domain FIST